MTTGEFLRAKLNLNTKFSLTPGQRNERDAQALAEKKAKKAAQKEASEASGGNQKK